VRVLVAGAAHRASLLEPIGRLFLLAFGWFGLLVHATILPDVGELETWRHCPRCGAGLEHDEDGAKVECPECEFQHHAHSHATACAVVVDDRGRVLLTRRAGPPYEGYWDLPGGFIGEAEHPHDAVRRELDEETGLAVEPRDLIGVWIDRYAEQGEDGPATMNLYFTATATGGEGEPNDDVAELRWVGRDEFPQGDELAFHIAEVLEAWRQQHA
jgi:8-oxo-dGTP diphosphatase